jgi:hypothetical protein
MGCYIWNKEVAAAFLPLLQVLEISLRNAIHKEANSAIGAYWFDNLAAQPSSVRSQNKSQQAAYDTHINKIRGARSDIQRKFSKAAINEDRIVSSVTFGLWTNLFNPVFELNRNPKALWPKLLRPVFPNAPKGYRDRAIIQQKLLAIKTFRNAAFHHEPVWNIGRPLSVNDAIQKLLSTKDNILEILQWICSDCVDLVEKAGYINTILHTCSVEHLNYLRAPGSNDKTLSQAKRELRQIFRNQRTTIDVIKDNKRLGKITSA